MAITPIIRDNQNTTKLMQYCNKHKHDECKVLSKKEELELIAKYKNVDLDLLRQKLIMHNVALVFKLATQYISTVKSFDDLVQRGMYALSYAAQKFDFNQTKTKFSSYAYNWIFKHIWANYYEDTKNEKDVTLNAISLDGAISDYSHTSKSDNSESGNMGNYLEDHLDPNSKAVIDIEEQLEANAMTNIYEEMRKYILTSDFNNTDRIVFNGRFVDNYSEKQISAKYNIPKIDVKSSLQKITSLMKSKLAALHITSMETVW